MTTFPEYEMYDALGLAELIAQKKVPAEDVLEAAIGRIEALNPRLNAVVQKMYDQARQTLQAGLPQGPLAGVPVPAEGYLHLVRRSTGGERVASL